MAYASLSVKHEYFVLFNDNFIFKKQDQVDFDVFLTVHLSNQLNAQILLL